MAQQLRQENLVTVARAYGPMEWALAASFLESANIRVWTFDQAIASVAWDKMIAWGGVSIRVPASQAAVEESEGALSLPWSWSDDCCPEISPHPYSPCVQAFVGDSTPRRLNGHEVVHFDPRCSTGLWSVDYRKGRRLPHRPGHVLHLIVRQRAAAQVPQPLSAHPVSGTGIVM